MFWKEILPHRIVLSTLSFISTIPSLPTKTFPYTLTLEAFCIIIQQYNIFYHPFTIRIFYFFALKFSYGQGVASRCNNFQKN